MPHHVDDEARRRRERQAEAVMRVVFAVGRDGGIDRDDQRLEPVAVGALDQLVRQLALLPDIELEPQPAADVGAAMLGDLLHRGHRGGGEGQRDLRLGGGLGEFEFALVPAQPGGAGGGDRHRQRGGLAEQRGGDAAAGHIDQRAMAQLDALEGAAVVGDGEVVLGGAIDEFEHALGQAALRGGAQVVDVEAAIEIRWTHLSRCAVVEPRSGSTRCSAPGEGRNARSSTGSARYALTLDASRLDLSRA